MKEGIARQAFETLANDYLTFVDTKSHNAYYERPAMIKLIDEITVENKIILDAGCAAGWYSQQLLNRGAEVIAMDISQAMIDCANERTNNRIKSNVANLEEPLDFVEGEKIDLIVSSLTLHYIENWELSFKEFYRVLKIGGHFILSVQHPMSDYECSKSGIYYDTELVDYTWKGMPSGPVVVPYYRRSFSEMINAFVNSGFKVKKVVEPKPTDELKKIDQGSFDKLSKQPAFICFMLEK